ncbi:hypothetical protein UlMin_044470 [Ulmus minor]
MEANKEEALKVKEIAEKRFVERDFAGAKNYALKAKTLCPGLEGISQMVTTFEVHAASEVKFNGEADYYSILGLKPFADKEAVKKQYKKMAVLLHPDKNKCVGADSAFKLVSEAWNWLSDNAKRKSYDLQRNRQSATVVNQTNLASVHAAGVPGFNNSSNSSTTHGRLDTFWTVCTSCKVQYEYLRKYVNKRLSCKNCRGVFIAVETGAAPANGSFPYTPWSSFVPGNGYSSHGYDGVTYVPSNATYFPGNGVSGYHSGHGYEYVSNVSFQWSSNVGVMGPTGPSTMTPDAVYHAHGNVNAAGVKVKSRSNGKRSMKNVEANANSIQFTDCNELSGSKVNRIDKRRKLVVGASFRNGFNESVENSPVEVKLENGNSSNGQDQKPSSSSEVPIRRNSSAPAFDARKMLMDKARAEILKKLEEMKLAKEQPVVAVKKAKERPGPGVGHAVVAKGTIKRGDSDVSGLPIQAKKLAPLTITVPDPDFHDFDRDRSEECFKPKQIWALYDEEDGMPRLYCLIREVISVKPFKIHITYLNSKTDSEFGSVNWLECGFTKSCGNFRAWTSDVVDQVNVFSHLLSREKAGRGGCVRIYPRSGDIWAVYRNWSRDWDRSTPDDVRHKYEMVEVLDDYSEELGVCVSPLVKMAGFKTVYAKNADKSAIRWIPRREMMRFSHQVPSWLLKGGGEEGSLPDKCWDLDPAATPDELLHAAEKEEAQQA